jgi:hypothetical protein
MWRNYRNIMEAAIKRSHHEPNPSKTGKAYRHFATVGEHFGFNSTPLSRNSPKARHCHAEQDVLRKLSPGSYDSLFVGRLASDFNEENLKFGNSKPCSECVDRIKNARNDGIFIKKVLWTNGEGDIDSCSVDKLESDHMTLHQRTQLSEHSACCLHNNHHHHDDNDEDDEDGEDADDDEAKRGQRPYLEEINDNESEYIKYKYIESDETTDESTEDPEEDPDKVLFILKIATISSMFMVIPYISVVGIVDCFN